MCIRDSLNEVINDPQAEALQAFERVPNTTPPFRTVSPPFALQGSEMSVRGPAPSQGQHTSEILSEVGLENEEIQELFAKKIVS